MRLVRDVQLWFSMPLDRFAAIALETSCPQCYGPIPLNGPVRFPTCRHCNTVIAIGPELWKTVFERAAEGKSGAIEGAHRLSLLSGVERPHCTRCVAHVPLAQVSGDGTSYCYSCGQPYESFPPPAWLKNLVPDAAQIVGAAREGIDGPAPTSARRWFIRFETVDPDAVATTWFDRRLLPEVEPSRFARAARAIAIGLPIMAIAAVTVLTAVGL